MHTYIYMHVFTDAVKTLAKNIYTGHKSAYNHVYICTYTPTWVEAYIHAFTCGGRYGDKRAV
jgi:hypothetical protein